ncbi:unnamed protein product [Dibothriocephalus latus]|uniref:Uncharacterized protein n=1 Tax=Dibothriocephalus latus TaxID=60516 RepID=A0A3P6SWN9_DIBLA|nr:unnamed protein product [Dibothriocephalus latus]
MTGLTLNEESTLTYADCYAPSTERPASPRALASLGVIAASALNEKLRSNDWPQTSAPSLTRRTDDAEDVKPIGTGNKLLFIFSEENVIRKCARIIIDWGYPFYRSFTMPIFKIVILN